MKCNKIKNMGISEEQIVEACQGSEEVEVSECGTMIRRRDNRPLPTFTGSVRRRDSKAQ